MQTHKAELKHFALTEKIIGVYYDVYNELGFGFLESVYREAMKVALVSAGLDVQAEVPMPVYFRGKAIGDYRADLLVNKLVVVELKTARSLESVHEAQLFHYLRATDLEIGLLFNFGPKPQFKRIAFDNTRKPKFAKAASQDR